MKRRNCGMMLRLTEAEMEALTEKSRKAGLSREGYCRRILNGTEVKEAPSADVPRLIQEIRRVGSNLNQILMRANSIGLLDVPQLRKDVADLRTVEKLIVSAYTTPSD